MVKSSLLAVLKRTSVVAAVAALMSVGSVANALDGLQLNQSITTTKLVQLNELQLATIICKGNWVNAGCTEPPPSAGSQGGQNPPPESGCVKFTSTSPTIILQYNPCKTSDCCG